MRYFRPRSLKFLAFLALAACSGSTDGGSVPVHLSAAPSQASLLLGGDSVRLVVTATQGGQAVSVTPTFTTLTPAVVTVNASGVVRALGTGAGTVRISGGDATLDIPVTVLDTGFVRSHVAVAGGPYSAARVSGSLYYVTNLNGSVVRFDAATGTSPGATMIPGSLPVGIVTDSAHAKAYVADEGLNRILVLNTGTHQVVDSMPIHGTPVPLELSADGSRLYAPTNLDRFYRINTAAHSILDSINTTATAHHTLKAPSDTIIYVANRAGSQVLEIHGPSMQVRRTFPAGLMTQGMAMTGTTLFVADEAGLVKVVNLASGTVSDSIPGTSQGFGMAISTGGNYVYVATLGGKIHVLRSATHTLWRTYTVGGTPSNIVFDPALQAALVMNQGGWIDIVR